MNSVKNTMKAIFFCLIVYFFVFSIQAQKNIQKDDLPDNCEMGLFKLALISSEFKQTKKDGSSLIVIGSPSLKEKSRYNSIRIEEAVNYFISKDIKNEDIVYAVGQKTTGLGYIRFYVNGEFVEEIKVRKNGKLCFEVD